MLVTRKSLISGKAHTLDIPITQEDYDSLIKKDIGWHHPTKKIQDALPYLNATQREFIMTGITQEEWDGMFSNTEDDKLGK